MKKEKKKRDLWFVMFGLGMLFIGIVLGMVFQQMILTASAVEIAEGLEGTTFNVEVDINETKLVEGIKEAFLPIINETRNLMLKENNVTGAAEFFVGEENGNKN